MSEKSTARLRRARRGRRQMRERGEVRLTVFRTPRHIYAQVFNFDGTRVLACASTLEKDLRGAGQKGKVEAAGRVGELLADRARKQGLEKVAFDRSGYKYHGRVKALAEGARRGGLQF